MRSFIITVMLLVSMISIIAANALYINNVTDKISSLVDDQSFKKAPEDALSRLESFWESNKILLEFSIGYKETDRMSELILDLRECIEQNNVTEEKRVRALISDCASDISRLEKLNLENLF